MSKTIKALNCDVNTEFPVTDNPYEGDLTPGAWPKVTCPTTRKECLLCVAMDRGSVNCYTSCENNQLSQK
jgi:hypothetical protein